MTLQARGTGRVDFQAQPATTIETPVQELAVRRGFPHQLYGRSGQVLFWDSFERDTLTWKVRSALRADAMISTAYARTGGRSLLIAFPPFASGFQYNMQIRRTIPYIKPIGKVGVEFSFTIPAGEPTDLMLRVDDNDDVKNGLFEVELDFSTDEAILRRSQQSGPNTYEVLGSIAKLRLDQPALFHTLKFVFDLDSKIWTDIRLDAGSFNVVGIPYAASVGDLDNSTFPHLIIWLQSNSSNTAGALIYVDDVIITREV